METWITNALIINEGKKFIGNVLVSGEKISKIVPGPLPEKSKNSNSRIVDAAGKYLMPGVIDDQVHFREPGLTHKGDIASESRAAVAGGITSYMEMPNTVPQATTHVLLEEKYSRAAAVSACNYSFYLGATNDNLEEIVKTDPARVCGVKVFMGSSTGNMLVDNDNTLADIFRFSPVLIATHCEDEATIQERIRIARQRYGEHVPPSRHAHIRNDEACFKSSSRAVDLAARFNARLHVLHLSTAKEMGLFSSGHVSDKRITAEVCVHHLWFDDHDYISLGNKIKWNPSVKSSADRSALREALLSDKIDVVATDHAPHTAEEKNNSYFKAPSGGPLVQHSLVAMLEMSRNGIFPIEKLVEKMCHAPADLFRISGRGYIREGYYADLVIVDPEKSWKVKPYNILYKCGWSPFEGTLFTHMVTHTFVNGHLVWHDGELAPEAKGMRLAFEPRS